MATKYIFMGLAATFLILAFTRFRTNKAQAKIWLAIAVIFGLVSALLYF